MGVFRILKQLNHQLFGILGYVWDQNEYGIRHGVNGIWIYDTGNTTISGNLNVSVSNARTSIKTNNTMEGYTSYIELETKLNSQCYLNSESNKPGAHYLFLTVKDDLHMYCGTNLVYMYKYTTIDGHLDVGLGASQTSIKAYVNHAGYQGNIQIEARWRSEGFIHSNTNHQQGYMFLVVKDALYLYCGNNIV